MRDGVFLGGADESPTQPLIRYEGVVKPASRRL